MAKSLFDSAGKSGRVPKEAGWLAAALAAGAVAGAGLMYLLDPANGRGRRARLREKSTKLAHRTGAKAGKLGRHLWNRGLGLAARMRKLTMREEKEHPFPLQAGKPELMGKPEEAPAGREKRAG